MTVARMFQFLIQGGCLAVIEVRQGILHQVTGEPFRASWIAMWVMAVVGVAPCQCFKLGGHQMTSPARISTIGSPSHCVQPTPEVTIKVWPSGCVCHAVRAPGSNVTMAPPTRAGSCRWNSESIRTLPVNHSSG